MLVMKVAMYVERTAHIGLWCVEQDYSLRQRSPSPASTLANIYQQDWPIVKLYTFQG